MQIETLEQYDTLYHKRFLEDARREAAKVQGGVLPTGTKMSQMLRHNFRIETLINIGNQVRHATMGLGVVEEIRTSKQGATLLKIRFESGREKELRADEVSIEGLL
jgi:hypothetical protein